MDVTKVIIPAAGLGTRFLPYTKAVPKELMPLIDRPAIHYILEEAFQSGIMHYCMVTGPRKTAIADYCDVAADLDVLVRDKHCENRIASLNKIIKASDFVYVRQQEPLGLGHAVLQARHVINKEHFGIMLPDDLIFGAEAGMAQLMRIARQEKGCVIAVQEVPAHMISSYGVVAVKRRITANLYQLSHVVEKPSFKDAPSNMAIVGRYILSHKIFSSLEEMSTLEGNELQLTDAIAHMIRAGEKVFAYKIQGTRYDIGTPLGWIKAVIGTALAHPEYGPQVQAMLADITLPGIGACASRGIEQSL